MRGWKNGRVVADLVADLDDGAGFKTLHIEGGLFRFHFGDDVALLHLVTNLHLDGDNLAFGQVLSDLRHENGASHCSLLPQAARCWPASTAWATKSTVLRVAPANSFAVAANAPKRANSSGFMPSGS